MIAERTSQGTERVDADGRDIATGRFVKGVWKGGKGGNPHAAKAAEFRAAVFETITRQDIADVIRVLIAEAKKGEPWAVQELLDRALGKAEAADLLSKVEGLEDLIAEAISNTR